MTFLSFKLIKYHEFCVALYTIAIGLGFVFWGFLSAPVYESWHAAGDNAWGLLLVAVGAAHMFALWLNGRNSHFSRIVRAVASSIHLAVAFQFAVFFIQGNAPWGALTMMYLMSQILPITGSAIDDAKRVWGSAK